MPAGDAERSQAALPGNIFVQFLAGPLEFRARAFGRLLAGIALGYLAHRSDSAALVASDFGWCIQPIATQFI
jgi:hypothetical protein